MIFVIVRNTQVHLPMIRLSDHGKNIKMSYLHIVSSHFIKPQFLPRELVEKGVKTARKEVAKKEPVRKENSSVFTIFLSEHLVELSC